MSDELIAEEPKSGELIAEELVPKKLLCVELIAEEQISGNRWLRCKIG